MNTKSNNPIEHLFLQVRTSLGVLQSVHDALLQLVGINLKYIVHLTNATGCKCLLVDMNVAIVWTSVGGINIKIHWEMLAISRKE